MWQRLLHQGSDKRKKSLMRGALASTNMRRDKLAYGLPAGLLEDFCPAGPVTLRHYFESLRDEELTERLPNRLIYVMQSGQKSLDR